MRAPWKMIQLITQLIAKEFSVGGVGEKRKVAWVSWDLVCKQKSQGGVGLREV